LVSLLAACALAVPFAACSNDGTSNASSDGGAGPEASPNPDPPASGGHEGGSGGSDSGIAREDSGNGDDGGKTGEDAKSNGPQFDVMTWVAPYNQGQWKAALERDTGGAHSPKNTLTRLAAQFWQVQSNGNLSLGASDEDTRWVADYSKNNGIEFLTCIHNYN